MCKKEEKDAQDRLGLFSEVLIEGYTKLAKVIKSEGSTTFIQLHHAGTPSPKDVINQKVVYPF
jgi:2,4-dienoyl-CoA reductase-like NADH-dependent reductase (Old Yellow Enzyme family)